LCPPQAYGGQRGGRWEQTLAGGFDCVHHKLMEVREADVEEDIWRVRVECRRLKEVKKIQFHLREMNLKSYIAE